MVKHIGIAVLMGLIWTTGAPEAAAQYATPPPPPEPPAASVSPPPAPVRVLPANPGTVVVQPRCTHCTIRCPGAARTVVRYRYRDRRCPRCSCRRRRYNKRLHRKGGPYWGFGMGYLGLMRPDGAYAALRPKVMLSAHLGWNFSPIFGLELGYQGGLFKQADQALGPVKAPSLFGVTLDLKFRLIRPRRYSRVIPYLQTGVGLYFAQATRKALSDCEDDKTVHLGWGGGLQVGGGLDIYLKPWLVLGAKVLYRPLFMSALRCVPGATADCGAPDGDPLRRLHGLSAEMTLSVAWPD